MMPEFVSSDLLTKRKAFQKYIENEKRKAFPFNAELIIIKKNDPQDH